MFAGLALFLTSLWNKGFVVHYDASTFIRTIAITATLYYLVRPLMKIIFFPINLFTFGLVSTLAYCSLFYLINSQFNGVEIKEWAWRGHAITQLQNIVLSSMSVSVIMGVLGKII